MVLRTMYDSVTATNCPPGAPLYMGYVDGAYQSYPQLLILHPDAIVVSITVTGVHANVGDCEPGAIWPPSKLVGWVAAERAAGYDPTGYCSESNWPICQAAFNAYDIPQPHWLVAGYATPPDPTIPPGAIGHQYAGGMTAPYDTSVVADYWPGVDPAPVHPPEESTVSVTVGPNGEIIIAAASPASHLLVFTATNAAGPWSVIDVTDKISTEAPGSAPYLVQP